MPENRDGDVNAVSILTGCSHFRIVHFPLIARMRWRQNRYKVGTKEKVRVLPFPHPPVLLAVCPKSIGKILIFDTICGYGLGGHPIEPLKLLTAPNRP